MATSSDKSIIVASILIASALSNNDGCSCSCDPDPDRDNTYTVDVDPFDRRDDRCSGCGDCSDPEPRCGDGYIEGDEVCEPGVSADETCQEWGYEHGDAVYCTSECQWSTADCSDSVCGDELVEGTEECDDGNRLGGDGCSELCVVEHCGDGVVTPELGEVCDGTVGCLDDCTRQAVADDGVCDEGEGWTDSPGVIRSADCRCGDATFVTIDADFLGANTTLEPFGCYRVASDLTVANLAVPEGVTLAFEDGAGWTIGDAAPASFGVTGTEDAPVIFASARSFTGETPQAGAWDGITVAHTDGTIRFDFVEVEAAGVDSEAAITIAPAHEGADVSVILREVTIDRSAGAGVRVEPDGGFATSPDAFTGRGLHISGTAGPAIDLRAHHVTGLWRMEEGRPAPHKHNIRGEVVVRSSPEITTPHEVWLAPISRPDAMDRIAYADEQSSCGLDSEGMIRCTGPGDDGLTAPRSREPGTVLLLETQLSTVERAWSRGDGPALRCGITLAEGTLACDLEGAPAALPDGPFEASALRPAGWGLVATTSDGDILLAPTVSGDAIEMWFVPSPEDPIADVSLQGSGRANDGLLYEIRESGALTVYAINGPITERVGASERPAEPAGTRLIPVRGPRPGFAYPDDTVRHPSTGDAIALCESGSPARITGDAAICAFCAADSEDGLNGFGCIDPEGEVHQLTIGIDDVVAVGWSFHVLAYGLRLEGPTLLSGSPPIARAPDFTLQGMDGIFEFPSSADLRVAGGVRVAVSPNTRVDVAAVAEIGGPDDPVTFVGIDGATWGPLALGDSAVERAVHVRMLHTGEDGALSVAGASGSVTATAIVASADAPISGDAAALASCSVAAFEGAVMDESFAFCTESSTLCPDSWFFATACDGLVECPSAEYDETGCVGDACVADAGCWGVCAEGVCAAPP